MSGTSPSARQWAFEVDHNYNTSHHQNEFDHISIYVRIIYLELQLGIDEGRRTGAIPYESSIYRRLVLLETSLGLDSATRSFGSNAVERLNFLETTLAGLTVEDMAHHLP